MQLADGNVESDPQIRQTVSMAVLYQSCREKQLPARNLGAKPVL